MARQKIAKRSRWGTRMIKSRVNPKPIPPNVPDTPFSVAWIDYHMALRNWEQAQTQSAQAEATVAALTEWIQDYIAASQVPLETGTRPEVRSVYGFTIDLVDGVTLYLEVRHRNGIFSMHNVRVTYDGAATPKAGNAAVKAATGKQMKFHRPTQAWALDFVLDTVPAAHWRDAVQRLIRLGR